MVSTALVCKYMFIVGVSEKKSRLMVDSYNGSSDLQLERMNVYFNEVRHLNPL